MFCLKCVEWELCQHTTVLTKTQKYRQYSNAHNNSYVTIVSAHHSGYHYKMSNSKLFPHCRNTRLNHCFFDQNYSNIQKHNATTLENIFKTQGFNNTQVNKACQSRTTNDDKLIIYKT